ncbi:MAG: hypothetical protein AAGG55_08290 [Pseudomonadota bacterium]
MRVLEAGDWSLLLPEEWFAEQEDDAIIVGDRDGVGCLEISELRSERGHFTDDEVREIAELGDEGSSVTAGSFTGLYASFREDDAALREWYLSVEGLMLYVTYSCDLDNQGLDDAVVDEIMGTLRYAAE